MVVDCLRNSGCYGGLGARFREAFDYLSTTDFTQLDDGRYELDGDRLFALVQRIVTKPRETAVWEAHRRYADVQAVVTGTELFGVARLDALVETQAYDAAKDVTFLSGDGDLITACAGQFLIFFPQDAHSPCLAVGEPSPVLKVVVKVALQE